MHNGYITIDNEKMSKSKGNFFTVRDILEKYKGEVIRYFLLSAHYRNPINFSEDLMGQAKNSLARIENAKQNLLHLMKNGEGSLTEEEKETLDGFGKYKEDFIKAMDDDLNTADGITAVFGLVGAINGANKEGTSKEMAEKSLAKLMELTDVLGLLQGDNDTENIDDQIEKLIEERQKAREEKNFARADEIRDILKEKGITIKDTPQGVQIIKE